MFGFIAKALQRGGGWISGAAQRFSNRIVSWRTARAAAGTSPAGAAGVRFMLENNSAISFVRDNIKSLVGIPVIIAGGILAVFGLDKTADFFEERYDDFNELMDRFGNYAVIGLAAYLALRIYEGRSK